MKILSLLVGVLVSLTASAHDQLAEPLNEEAIIRLENLGLFIPAASITPAS